MSGESLCSWAAEHVWIDGDTRLSFEDFAFMEGMYWESDFHPWIVCKKSNQCGASLWAAVESIYWPSYRGENILYYFPTDVAVRDLVREKVDPVLMADPMLRSHLEAPDGKGVANLHSKKINGHWARYLGARAPLNRQRHPADLVFFDERDDFEEAWIPEISKRMNASRRKWRREFSRPTYVGGPIDNGYDNSDQRRWMTRCDGCGAWNDLDWFRDVVVQETATGIWKLRDTKWRADLQRDPHLYCPGCGKPRDRLKRGQWVAAFPERRVAGFHVNRLYSPLATIRELWSIHQEAHLGGDESHITQFYNGDLGLAYTPGSAALTESDLLACVRRYAMPKGLSAPSICTAGFDVQGGYLVGRISQIVRVQGERIRRAVWIGRTTWEALGALLDRFPVKVCVIDGEYDPTACEQFQKDRRGQVWLAYYPAEKKAWTDWYEPNAKTRWVAVDRERSLDRSQAEVLNQHNHLPGGAQTIPTFFNEMTAAVRVEEEDSRGIPRFRWRKKSGRADDARHADNYDLVAAELLERGFNVSRGVAASKITSRQQAMDRLKQGG
jgi:hypothetical protein